MLFIIVVGSARCTVGSCVVDNSVVKNSVVVDNNDCVVDSLEVYNDCVVDNDCVIFEEHRLESTISHVAYPWPSAIPWFPSNVLNDMGSKSKCVSLVENLPHPSTTRE